MICLVIDTSTSYPLVSIVEDSKIKYYYNSKIEKDLSASFMNIISDGFNHAGIFPNDVDKIFVSNGPGSFTGIRIGLTFAKIYGFCLKKDIIPFSTLELFSSSSNEKSISVIDAKRGYVFCGIYDEKLNNIFNDKYINLDEIMSNFDFKDYKIYSYDKFDKFETNNPQYNVLKIIEKHLNDTPINPHELLPKYLKQTQAEERILNDKTNN